MGGAGSGRRPMSILVICPKCGKEGRFYIWKHRLAVRHEDGKIHYITRMVRKIAKNRDFSLPVNDPDRVRLLEYAVLKLRAYLQRKLEVGGGVHLQASQDG